MNKLKIFSAVFLFLLLFSVSINASATEEERFYYKIENGAVILTGVTQKLEGDVTVPETIIDLPVKKIDKRAFVNQSGITKIVLPESVNYIGSEAFSGCEGLYSIGLGSAEKLGSEIFAGCKALKQITLPSDFKTVYVNAEGEGAFADSFIEKVTFEDGASLVPSNTFSGCTSLKEVNLPGSVAEIQNNAFDGCKALEKVSLSEGLKKVGEEAFTGCEALCEITLPDSIEVVGDNAFRKCISLSKVDLGCVEHLGLTVFFHCTSLESITIPKQLVSGANDSIRYGVFSGSAIKRIVFENGIVTVPDYFCAGCSEIEEIVFCDSITKIGVRAFIGCTGLSEFSFPGNLNTVSDSAFRDCRSIEKLVFSESIKEVEKYAFSGCENLSGVELSKVSVMGARVFENCNKLTCVAIPAELQTVKKSYDGYGVLSGSGVEKVIFKSSVEKIPMYICSMCTNLTSVEIPESVTEIGKSAFYNCNNLKDVYYVGKKSQWNEIETGSYNDVLSSANIVYDYDNTNCTHSFKKYVSDKNATYSSDGTKTALCSKNCGRKKTITDKGSKLILGKTSKITVSQTEKTVTLKWNKVSGAHGYRIYKMNESTGKLSKVVSNTGNVTSYTLKKLSPGTKYIFVVRAYVKEGKTIWAPDYTKAIAFTKPVNIFAVSASRTQSSVTLSWKKVSCTAYRVRRYNTSRKKWETVLKNVKTNKVTIKDLSSGKKYIFSVQPYVDTGSKTLYSSSYTKAIFYTLLPCVSCKVSKSSQKSAVITWSESKGAAGYQVWYKEKSAQSYKKLGNFKRKTAIHTGLKRGKTYYYKVRSYKKTDSGYIYSAWSSVKKYSAG